MEPSPLVRFADRHPTAWANGRGSTTELVDWAAGRALSGPNGAVWRLSVARLDGPAPFSPLPGVDRHFLPVDAAVVLRIGGTDVHVAAGAVGRFSGDDVVARPASSRPRRTR